MFPWVNRTCLDPTLKVSDDLIGELALGGHFQIFLAQGFQQEALGNMTRDDRRSGVAAGANPVLGVQQQTPFLFAAVGRFNGVAFIAVGDEDRADF